MISVVSRCGHWVQSLGGVLNDVISDQCVFKFSNLTSLPCFHLFSGTPLSIFAPSFLKEEMSFLHSVLLLTTIYNVWKVDINR